MYSTAMREPFRVKLLADHFGQYTLLLTCGACHHQREAQPQVLAKLCGWNSELDEVAKRLRCSKCGRKECSARAVELVKPRGYRNDR